MSRAIAAALAVCLAAVAACEGPGRPIRVAIHSAPVELDPHLQNESLTSGVLANVYEALTELDAENRVRPKIASGWTNPDERTWVFSLRAGARFHDGRALTAGDVVFSLERARRHPGSALASYLVEVESVRVVDDGRVEIRTRRPFASLLGKLTPVYVVPAGSPERITEPVGTGPYRLVHADRRGLELVPVATSTERPEAPGPLHFVVEPDPARRLSALLDGEVEVAADLGEDAVDLLATTACCRAELLPGSTIEYLHLSSLEPPFRDRRVREAVHLALDRTLYLAEARHGLGQPAGQLAVPGLFGYEPGLRAPERDLVRARALLEAAGYAEGFDVVLEHRPGRRADVLVRQLGEAGIRVAARESAWAELYGRLRNGEVGFYFGGVVSPTGEASDVLDGYVHSREEDRGYGASNHSRYSNRTADGLIEAASSSFSLVRRRELLQEAMKVVMADLHLVPVAGLYQVYGTRRDVEFRPRIDLKLLGDRIRRRWAGLRRRSPSLPRGTIRGMAAPSTASSPALRSSPVTASPVAEVEARHVAHVLDERLGERGDGTALRHLVAGQWRDISWRELAAKVRDLSSALVEAGVAEGDRVAILAANRPEWTMADLAILRVRGVSVPIHATSSSSQVAFILKDSGARVVFVDAGEPASKVVAALGAGVPLDRVIVFGGGALPEGAVFADFEGMLSRGRAAAREDEVAARLSRATPDDLLTLLYTSGTTGEPKGVMLPHSAFTVTCTYHDLRLPPIGPDDVSLCFLPLSHIFERAWTFYILYRGAVTAYCEDPKKVSEVLPQVRPTLMCAVPRLYEKAYTKIQERVRSSSAPKRALFRWAIGTGHAVSLRKRTGDTVPRLLALRHALADRLVLAKIRAAFGGRPRLFPCAGAPLAPEIEEFFHSVGVFVCQGYGLTETTATVTCHDPSRFHVGTVGSPLPGVEVRISEEGEVLVKGRTVMKGYWNRPEETAAVFRDGWLRTGDAGEICEDGTLKITDRIKDLIKTAGGRYVAPQHVETTIGADPLVEQVAVIGEGRKYVTALVVPAFEALEKWARAAGISFSGRDELVRNERVLDLLKRTIEERTKDLAPWEKVRKFSLLTKEFSVEGGSMTPTQKVRRRAAAELYSDRIEEMYTGD